MKINKKFWKNTIIIGAILLFILVIVYGAIKINRKGSTELKFSAGTDVPDPMLELKKGRNTPDIIETGKEYNVMLSIKCNEVKKTDYVLRASSKIFENEKFFSMSPGEKKNITYVLRATTKDKWMENSTSSQTWRNEISIVENTWFGDKKQVYLLLNDKAEDIEDFYLPVSNDIGSSFGRIYHTDITLEGLRKKPFTKSFVTDTESADTNRILSKNRISDNIKLSVESGKLVLDAERKTATWTALEDIFLISLEKPDSDMAPQTLKFEYTLR